MLNWVQFGFPLLWAAPSCPPPSFSRDNNPDAYTNSSFVDASIADLLRAGAIAVWPHQPFCVHPLNVVSRSNGKQRLILDLRHVNQHLNIPKFRLDALHLLSDIADWDDYMFSLDLASGYHQVMMAPSAFPYLGFHWNHTFYVYKVLPFGLATAPWCFSKIMRVICTHLRFRNVRLLNYLDDFLFLVKPTLAEQLRALTLSTFEAAGLAVNKEKSHLSFSRRIVHLGFVVDFNKGTFELTPERFSTFQGLVSQALSLPAVECHLIQRITGHISSMLLVLGTEALMYTRACHLFTANKSPRYRSPLPTSVQEELRFWQHLPISSFSTPIWPPLFTPHLRLECDAGAHGWAGVLGNHRAHGFFPIHLSHDFASSTLREFLGILHSLQSFLPLLRSSSVQIITDNSNAPSVCKRGSPKFYAQ